MGRLRSNQRVSSCGHPKKKEVRPEKLTAMTIGLTAGHRAPRLMTSVILGAIVNAIAQRRTNH